MFRCASLSIILLFLCAVPLIAQERIIYAGTVSEADGKPISGANIITADEKRGTLSAPDGSFSITLPDSIRVLEVSHIGYHPRQVILSETNTSLQIILDPKTLNLGEVTITALGIARQERALGYSVTTVKGDDLDPNAINPIAALQGKVAGLNISGAGGGIVGRPKVTLRGASTLGNNNQPLIIVDGMAINTSVWETAPDWVGSSDDWGDELKNLNTADIESVSVLKGAAATALYGSRGMNGALVITTKNGGNMAFLPSGKTIVTLTQSTGFDLVTATPDLQSVYGPGAIAGDITYGQRTPDGGYYRWDTEQFYTDANGNPTLIGASGNGWGPRFDGRGITQYDGTAGKYSPQKNAYRSFYRPAVQSNTNLSIRGGTERTSFYLSAGYRYADGTLPSSSYSRGSLLFKGSQRIGNRIVVDAQVAFAQSRPQNISPSVGDYFINRSVNQLYDADYYRHKYKGDHGGMAGTSYGDAYANVPLKDMWWQIYENSVKQRETSVRPAVNVAVEIAPWLVFCGEAAADYYNTSRETKMLGQGYRNEGNDYTLGGHYEMRRMESREQTFAGTFTAKKTFGDFELGGFVRGEYRNSFADRTVNATAGGLVTPGIYSVANSRNTPFSEYVVTARKRVASAAFAVNAGWRNQLYLEATGRNDWSSSLVYSDGNGDYSYFYPSVSASWVVTSTFAKKLPDWITFGKLRLSWAQVGNDAVPFALNPGYEQKKYLQPDGSYIHTEVVPATLLDGTLRPERKTAWEAGADWRFFDGRIGFDFTSYKENTRNQILSIPIPEEAETTLQLLNAGNIENRGVELVLHAIPIKTNDWQWDIDLTWAKNRNRIVSLHPDVQNHITLAGWVGGGNYRVASVAMEGGPYGMLVSDIAPARDQSGNTILTWDDEYRVAYAKRSENVETLGSMMPDWTGSIATGLRYKNFTFRALLDICWGGFIASYSNRYGTAYGLTEQSLRWRDAASGGASWTSNYADSYGQSFHDGVIPHGIFDAGTVVTTPSGDRVDVSGMTFREAYERGYVEPVHSSTYQYHSNGWSTGTVNDSWVHEVKYIALRELSVGYRLPDKAARKLGMQKMNITLSARNLGYLYNSLPNNLNPESVMGTATGEFRERGFIPYTATFMATVTMEF